jgi:hypothetical protein
MTDKKVVRTTAGLVEALFDTVDKLNSKEIDAEHARAISHTARSIVGVARLELEYRQFAQNGGPQLTSLTVDKPLSPPIGR